MERHIDTERQKKYKPKPPVKYLERVDRRSLPGSPFGPAERREIAAKKIARALSNFATAVDSSKVQDTRYFELIPYGIQIVDNFIKDFKLKAPVSKKVEATKSANTANTD